MNKDQPFQQRIKDTLDRQTLDPENEHSLQRARKSALDSGSRRATSSWIPATAAASLVVAIVVVYLFQSVGEIELPQVAADDLAVISSEDELELFEELEFYVWFDQDKNV